MDGKGPGEKQSAPKFTHHGGVQFISNFWRAPVPPLVPYDLSVTNTPDLYNIPGLRVLQRVPEKRLRH